MCNSLVIHIILLANEYKCMLVLICCACAAVCVCTLPCSPLHCTHSVCSHIWLTWWAREHHISHSSLHWCVEHDSVWREYIHLVKEDNSGGTSNWLPFQVHSSLLWEGNSHADSDEWVSCEQHWWVSGSVALHQRSCPTLHLLHRTKVALLASAPLW